MPITSERIRATTGNYLHRYREDRDRLAPLTAALAGGWKLTDRAEKRGHVTAAVFLVREDSTVLHVLHNQTGLWLAPGGHPEDIDSTLGDAALRELAEETGLQADRVLLGPVVDIDVHTIKANPQSGEGEHRHFDFRFTATLTGLAAMRLDGREVRGARWTRLDPGRYPKAAERLASGLRHASGHAL